MTWLVWRQHRGEALIASIGLGILAAVLIITGIQITASFQSLGVAACVAGSDPEKIKRLPDTTGMKNEVIIQKKHRYAFDHAIRNVGVRLVEVETEEDLEQCINEKTAMLHFLNEAQNKGQIGLQNGSKRASVIRSRRSMTPRLTFHPFLT